MKTPSILIAEDDELDVQLLRHAFEKAGVQNSLVVTRDGQDAIEYLTEAGRCSAADERLPCLLISDLKMPRRTGMELLSWLRGEPILRCLPVIIFSSSAHPHDVGRAYRLGANAFVVKPSSINDRIELVRSIKDFWLDRAQLPLLCKEDFAAAQAPSRTRPAP